MNTANNADRKRSDAGVGIGIGIVDRLAAPLYAGRIV
jgi:hypothetical protein